ncbi:MAG: hypothetical protein AAF570_27985, partial [Bacteroidota bacterium]
MINLTKATEEKLGYHRLREILAGKANTEAGKALCEEMRPLRSHKAARKAMERAVECRDLILLDEPFTLGYSGRVNHLLDHAAVPGNWLNPADLFSLLKWLRMVRDILNYFKSRREKYPRLWEMLR